MRELRIHGRGGQGTVIASKLLAVALFREGHEVQSFPAFGVERRGAPVTAFLRFDDSPIRLRCEITEPNHLIVLDPTLIDAIDVTAGVDEGGTTVDGKYTLETEECLAGCDHAPCMLIGERKYKNVKCEDIPKILADPDNSKIAIKRSPLFDPPGHGEK